MSLSVIPLTILGQITGVSGSGDTVLYQVSFKSIDGTPLYGVTAVWTDEQAEIEALAAEKPYGVWINPIDGTFTVKFAGYTYVGSADLTDDDVLAGVTPIEFITTEVNNRLLPEVTAEDDGKIMQVMSGEWTKMAKAINVSYSSDALSKIADKLGTHISTVLSNPTNHYSISLLISPDEGFTEDEFNSIRETLVFCLNSKNLSPIYLNGILLTQIESSNILTAPYIYLLSVGNTEYRIVMQEKYIVYESHIDCYVIAQALIAL